MTSFRAIFINNNLFSYNMDSCYLCIKFIFVLYAKKNIYNYIFVYM